MAKKETKDTYKTWVEETLKKLPADKVDAFKLLVADEDLANPLFGGYMREADYYQRVQEAANARKQAEEQLKAVEDTKTKLSAWYQENKPLYEQTVEENAKLKSKLKVLVGDEGDANLSPEPQKTEVDPRYIKKMEDMESRLATMDKVLPQFFGKMFNVQKRILKDGWDINPDEVINYSVQNGVDPETAYDALTYDKRVEKYNADMEEEKKKWIAEGRKQALSQLSTPDSVVKPGPSIFDTLNEKPSADPVRRVDKAVASFLEIGSNS